MVFSGGILTVTAGTELRIESAITWQIAPGATVVNHGRIDFGTQGALIEQDGSPITGSGTETAQWAPSAPLVDAEPGGLGLRLNTAYADGGLVVERGHLPRSASNGVLSIGRWYMISTPQATTESMDANLRYDLSELNGAAPEELSIFNASSAAGPWTPSISSSNPALQEVSANVPSPLIFLTAFDHDAAMGLSEEAPDRWKCWPSVIDQEVWLRVPPQDALRALALFDAGGRAWSLNTRMIGEDVLRIELPPLAAGLYHLRINDGAATFKLMKP